MQRIASFGITGWSWLNALGARSFLADGAATHVGLGDDPLAGSGLEPHDPSLGIAGFWGRVRRELPPLPPHLERHQSRCAELLLAAVAPLEASIRTARRRHGPERVAVVLGSSTGGIDATEHALAVERKTGRMPDEFVFEEAHVYHALVQLLRETLELEGLGFVISTACSSAGKALGSAQRLLASGLADAVVTGGVDALSEMTVRGFAGLGIVAAEGCRPFDRTRRGISLGEGAALLLVERDSSSPYRLLGVGESNDAYHATAPHPEGLGARLAMQRALDIAGLAPSAVDYVNAHGTGTEQNDSAEARALFDLFGPGVVFSSTKDRVGHQLGTAGATEATFCLEALVRGAPPGNRVPTERDDALALQPFVAPRAVARPLTVALSNSFAFGGSNVSVAIGRGLQFESPPLPPAPRFFVRAAALWADGFENAEAYLAGERSATDQPAASFLPPRQRGRASPLTRSFAELYGRLRDLAPFDAASVSLFFGSAYGEMTTTLALLDQIGVDTTLSPAKFQSSVHNTAAGLLTLQTENRGFSTAIAAGPSTFAMTLTDALAYLGLHGGEAVLLCADEKGPERMLRGKSFPALGIGFVLAAAEVPPADALVEISVTRATFERADSRTVARDFAGLDEAPMSAGLDFLRAVLTRGSDRVRVGPRSEIDVRALDL